MKIDDKCVCGAVYQLDTGEMDPADLYPSYDVWRRIHKQCEEAQEMARLRRWVADLQSKLYINCVYCGHQYGPNEAEVPQETLRRHVAECPQHPMSHLINSCQVIIETLRQCHKEGGTLTIAEKMIYADLVDAVKRARG